ncbi:hypothetical protein AB7M47_000946 [Bradyrhizobium elkanii]
MDGQNGSLYLMKTKQESQDVYILTLLILERM